MEERAGLELSFLKRISEENLSEMKFWGKIFGASTDYLISVSSVTDSDFPKRRFFFCTGKDFTLQALPEPVNDEITAAIRAANSHYKFSGDPSFQMEEEERRAEGKDDEEGEDLTYREINHLSYVVRNIDRCSIIPAGAYILNASDLFVPNSNFAGLDFTCAVDLANYRHFRRPLARPAMWDNRGALADASKLLDVVGGDRPAPFSVTPVGCWSIVRDANGRKVRIRSFEFPGFNFFHVIGTPVYGNFYFGDGNMNLDFSFMV